MPVRTAEAEWTGTVTEGRGSVKLGSGAFEGAYSFRSRMEDGVGTNPEELIGAAHAGCFSMALSGQLTRAGITPTRIHTTAQVRFDKVDAGFAITNITLNTEVEAPGLEDAAFQQHAQEAKMNCPVSKALAGTQINLQAKLL
ncbi:MAG: OsmC family protein [Acidobacteria bacterium]|nr:OsmC family protein [Acidobacteriota bacterium]